MIEKSLITKTEREVFQQYDRQRRSQMLRLVTPAFLAFCLLVVFVATAFLLFGHVAPVARDSLVTTDILLIMVVIDLLFGLVATRKGHLRIAAALVAAASAAGTAASVAVWSHFLGLDPFVMIELTPFSIVIVVAGLLGDIWGILASTVVMNIVTVIVLVFAPRALGVAVVMNAEMPLILPVALVHQWAFAILTIALWRNFQRTLGEIGTAYERAKQLDVLKDEFISSVNHELRTPLMTMQTYLETLRESRDRLSPEQVSLALDQACRVSDSLVDLVKSILSTRRIDQDAVGFAMEPVSVADALAAAISLVNPREASLADREMHITVPDDLTVWGEHVRLQQVLTNLLANAAKYSPSGTPIEVVAQLVQQGSTVNAPWRRDVLPAVAEIRVRDYGQGIPPDQIPLLFNRFVRLPRDLASKITGTGLGLYLCRVLAEAMDGRIWVESTGVAGEGSTFYLRLPAVAPGGGPGRPAPLVTIGNVHDADGPRPALQAGAPAHRLTGARAP